MPYQTSNQFQLYAGSYTFSIKDANGCIKTGTVTLTQPSSGGKIIHSNKKIYINL